MSKTYKDSAKNGFKGKDWRNRKSKKFPKNKNIKIKNYESLENEDQEYKNYL
jgi:hypothetical protein